MPSYRIWGSTDDGEIEFESLTTETLEGAINVIRESFFIHEPVCQGVDLLSEPGAAEELEELCYDAAKDGVSVVAVEVATGKVVAASFNKIQILPPAGAKGSFQTFIENCKYNSSRALVEFMNDVDSRFDIFEHYNVQKVLEIMFIATLPSHCKRRLGELVVAASVEIARQLKAGNDVKTPVEVHGAETITNRDAVPEICSAICTSAYTHKICRKLGFDFVLDNIQFTEFQFKGKKFSDRIKRPEHEYVALVTKRISPISIPR